MNPQDLINQTEQKLKAAVEHFGEDIKKLRTGRAHPSMLDGVVAEAYGSPMPLNQLATITAPEPQLLQISPFDPSNIQSIASAIRDNQTLGLNPSDDGRIVRVPIPALTEERRQQIVKQLGEKVEECMIAQRSVRRDVMTELDQAKKDKDVSEDDHKRLSKQVDDLMAKYKLAVDELAKAKETEIMTV
jgi:ribosome recycling factor